MPTRRAARPPAAWSSSSTPRPCCARPTTTERKRTISEKIKDAADLFAAEGEGAREVLEGLKGRAQDALDLGLAEAPEASARERYRYAKERILPLLLRLEDEGERGAGIEDAVRALKLKTRDLRAALAAAARAQEERAEREPERDAAPEPGTVRHEEAMKLLESPDLFGLVAGHMELLGHVGERAAKLLAFTCAMSAPMGRPIQPSTHAQSSAGKNALWDTVLTLLPPEMVIRRTGLSAKALFRTAADLSGKVLYIQEVTGSEEADYTVRTLQSDGRLVYEATEKTPDGGMENVVHEVEGPTVVVQTTTKNHLHPENETRVLPIYIDESREQTRRIVERYKEEAAGGGIDPEERERVLRRWRDAVRLLDGAEVVIPFARRIEMPDAPVRIRRDARRLLDVVRVIAWVRQHQRDRDEKGRVVATEGDFREALGLVGDSFVRAWRTLTPTEEEVLRAVRDLPAEEAGSGFKRQDVRIAGVSPTGLKDALRSLTDTGYLDCDGRRGPQGYTYTLANDAEKIDLGIRLRPPSDEDRSPANESDRTGRGASVRYDPASDTGDEEELNGRSAVTGRDDDRPKETPSLQEEQNNGRSDDLGDDNSRDEDWYEDVQKVFEGKEPPERFDPTCPAVANVIWRRTNLVEKGRYRPWG